MRQFSAPNTSNLSPFAFDYPAWPGENQRYALHIDSGLYVLVDLAGVAAVAASAEDYLIPSSILNATLSGLISRSVLNFITQYY
jgi:hypothetical protein